jgi:putative ABC transport system permease protein
MSKATAAIALLLGSVGVANTVLMSVFERFHEIGVLLAIGWRRRRILAMIMCESLVLGLTGGVMGSALGIATIKIVERLPIFRGKLEGDVSVALLGMALAIAISVSVLGGLYPAFRASRLKPAEALRYE